MTDMAKLSIGCFLLGVLALTACGGAAPSASELGERYWRTKAETDRRAWIEALDREGHDFTKHYTPDYGPRGLYKFNRDARLACFVITKAIAEKLGKDTYDAETADGPVHFEWMRQTDGSIDYRTSAPTNWDVFVQAYRAKKKRNPKPEANHPFSTSFPRRGVVSFSLTHHREDWVAGPHANVPFPTNEIKAIDNFLFGTREALSRLGFDREDSFAEGWIWIGSFDSNFPNGHTDFPAHFHIMPSCRDGKQVHHFYTSHEDGRIVSDCYQDMSSVIDVWDRAVTFRPGDEFPFYDGHGQVAFRLKLLEGGVGLEFSSPSREIRVRVTSPRPCDGVDVQVFEPTGWRTIRTIAVRDDPLAGVLETPDGTIRYDPATGKLIP